MKYDSPKIITPTTADNPFEFGFSTHISLSEEMFDVHYELEIGVVMSGVMHRTWEDAARTLGPGDVWINSIWEPHRFSLVESPCMVAVFLLRPEVLASLYLGHLGHPGRLAHPHPGKAASPDWLYPFFVPPATRPTLPDSHRPVVLDWLNRLSTSLDVKTVCAADDCSQQTESFLLLLYLLNILATKSSAFGASAGKDIQMVAPALELVFGRKTMVTEAEGAHACHMSASTFRRRFKRAMGVSFGKFGIHHRLKSASLDMTGSIPIEDIADRWGFSDVSHFHRAFKKMFRQTPAQYRRGLSSAPERNRYV
ncbi:MAG: helix-turn-helix transcriptional regulator [Deltaproteobacteria bacterium]|nr:helix-turn-helix transcriptional regulator [Deltaproteobacteria bacterium]